MKDTVHYTMQYSANKSVLMIHWVHENTHQNTSQCTQESTVEYGTVDYTHYITVQLSN